MKLVIIIIALSGMAVANVGTGATAPLLQTGNNRNNSTSITCVFPNNVTSGNIVLVGANWESGTLDPVVTDTLLTSYSKIIKDTSGSVHGALYIGTTVSGGANTVTIAETSGSFMGCTVVEIPVSLWSVTVDVSDSKVTTGTPASPSGNAISTTVNGDFFFSYIGGFSSSGVFQQGTGFNLIGFDNGSDSHAAEYLISGAPGSNTGTWANANNSTVTVFTVALKPASFKITSPATLPDGALTNAYNFCLTAIGGTGASYTWTITSGALQTGLSMNSSTGCITGTPTSGPQNSITFHVTDGSTSPSNLSATLKVGNTLNTIAHIQDSNGTTGVFSASPTIGNTIFVVVRSDFSGAGIPKCSDTLSTPYQLISTGIMGSGAANQNSQPFLFAGKVPSTGADTVTCGASGSVYWGASEFSNVFLYSDNTVLAGANSGATYTSGTLTTLVPNQLLFAFASAFTNASTLTANSPFTATTTRSAAGLGSYNLSTTVTTYSTSFGASGNTDGHSGIILAGFRPTANGTAPGSGSLLSHHGNAVW